MMEPTLPDIKSSLKALIDNIDGMVYRCLNEKNWPFEYVSKPCLLITGYKPEEFLNKEISYGETIHPEDRDFVWNTVQKRIKEKKRFKMEYRINHKDLGERWVWEQGTPMFDEFGNIEALEGLIVDITQQKNLEKKLKLKSDELDITLKSIADGVIATDNQGRIALINEVAREILHQSHSSCIGKQYYDILKIDDIELNNQFEKLVNDPVALMNFNSQSSEIKISTTDNFQKILSIKVSSMQNDKKQKTGLVFVFTDISDRVIWRSEMLKIQKLDTIGLLAGGLAHDFNNLLMGVLGNIFIAKEDIDNKEETLKSLDDAENALIRARDLTRQLLTFTISGITLQQKPTKLNILLQDIVDFSQSGSNLLVNYDIQPNLWTVNVDQNKFQQVVNNIVINAMQAMPQGGNLVVKAENIRLPNILKEILPQGNYVHLEFKDEGIGIAKEDLPKVFDPYYTTKEKGTGLGLTMSYNIIRRHGGTIRMESKLKSGTTVHIYIPKYSEKINTQKASVKVRKTRTGNILIMDDDEAILKVLTKILYRMGYNPTSTKNGEEMLEIYKKHQEEGILFDAVILDLTIKGGMGGKDAIIELRKIDPNVVAIVSTGYSTGMILEEYEKYGFSGKLSKPYTYDDLLKILDELKI